MRMQASYDIARTRRREGEATVERYRPAVNAGSSRRGAGSPD